MRNRLLAAALLFVSGAAGSSACATASAGSAASPGTDAPATGGGAAPAAPGAQAPAGQAPSASSAQLKRLLEEDWEWRMKEFPTFATYLGDLRYNDQVTDLSPESIERRRAYARELLKRTEAIDPAGLTEEERLNRDLFLYEARLAVEGERFPEELMAISAMGGIHTGAAELAQAVPKATVKHYEDFLARLRATPRLVDQTLALLERGLEKGVTPPQATLVKLPDMVALQLVEDPRKSPVFTNAFEGAGRNIPPAELERLKGEMAKVLGEQVVPAYRKLHGFLKDRYVPGARKTFGLSQLPDGKAWYDYQVKVFTTLDRSAEEVHQLGLSEVARIRAEMEKVKAQAGFKGDLQAFFRFLRTDPRFFHKDKEALLREYRDIAKRIDGELPRLFGKLPRLPYGVKPVPAFSERTQTTAYYNGGSEKAGRAGFFYANTYDLKSRPRWEMEALTVHEAMPGHHLQIALAQELEGLPPFRQQGGQTAFIEGWGLYSESLGAELGLYTDPYSRFGQLTYEMWRAVRLVVDTGMHAKGWTREQAITYFEQNASKARHDIEVEIDRYLGWPGQALAYKTGELKLKELRARAEQRLGERFDVRAFHDVVLGAGALPLPVLEGRVQAWLDGQAQGRAGR
jgi:uncharacterized protein (DUF885 family)